jgi:RAB protein geranylgeranyltransferase component A
MYLSWIHVCCLLCLQQNEYYGQDFASFPLAALQDWAQHQQQLQAQPSAEAPTAGCEP